MCQFVLLAQRGEDFGVTAHRDVDDPASSIDELVLAQHTEAHIPWIVDAAVAGGLVLLQDLQERRLAGPVGTYEPIAGTSVEFETGMLEQHLGGERLAES